MCMREMRESARTMGKIPAKRGVEEEAEESELDTKEDISGYLKAWADGLFMQFFWRRRK